MCRALTSTYAQGLAFKPTWEKGRNQNVCMCTHRDGHTHMHTQVHHTFSWEQIMGTETWLVPCLPPTRVATSLMSLSISFCYTVSFCTPLRSVNRPEALFHCKLLFSGKLSKALIGEKGEKPLPELPISLPPPPPRASLWCFIQHHHTHKSCSEIRLQCVILG